MYCNICSFWRHIVILHPLALVSHTTIWKKRGISCISMLSFTVCIWCCFAFFYHIVCVIQYFSNANIPSKFYYFQEEQFWEASVFPVIFAYLRIPDGYLDSSVLLASETWDSCPWKHKNTENLKTTVNLDLGLLSFY